MKVERAKNRLYIVDLDHVDPICFMSSMEDSTWKWHACYRHVNFQVLYDDNVKELCDGCLIGKQRQAPFPREGQYRASRVLELVNGDLHGPITPTTPRREKVFSAHC
jgi:hypothetical protein